MATETTHTAATSKLRVLCELDASTKADELLGDALALCEEHGAELFIVWVLEPRVFSSPLPGSAGAIGTFGLPHVLHAAIERARERGVTATSAVRIGEREIVLRREAEAIGAAALFRLYAGRTTPRNGETEIVRCPRCGARRDDRAVHFCPRVYLEPAA